MASSSKGYSDVQAGTTRAVHDAMDSELDHVKSSGQQGSRTDTWELPEQHGTAASTASSSWHALPSHQEIKAFDARNSAIALAARDLPRELPGQHLREEKGLPAEHADIGTGHTRVRTEIGKWFGFGLGDAEFDKEMRAHITKVHGHAFSEGFGSQDMVQSSPSSTERSKFDQGRDRSRSRKRSHQPARLNVGGSV